MDYRKINRLGIDVSVIGLGLEHLDGKPYAQVESTIHAAMDKGINIMDLFMPGEEVRQNIAKALKGRRDKVYIQGMIGSTDINQQYDISRDLATCKKYFDNLLKHVDYIDFGMLFFMDSEKAVENIVDNGILDYARDLKKAGKIRAIGASSHNPTIAKKLVDNGWIDTLLFSINPAFDMTSAGVNVLDTLETGFKVENKLGIKTDRNELYRACEQNDVSITVMKTLGAGKLLSAEHTPFSKPMTSAQCIHYALSRPAVVSVLLGCKTPEEVEDSVKYCERTDAEKDYSWVFNESKASMEGSCVYCSHCQPCPAGIDIAMVNKYLDIALLDKDNVPQSVKKHYNELENKGSQCIQCGSCEEKCPFSVKIIENMGMAEKLFE